MVKIKIKTDSTVCFIFLIFNIRKVEDKIINSINNKKINFKLKLSTMVLLNNNIT